MIANSGKASTRPVVGMLCLESPKPADPRFNRSPKDPRNFKCDLILETIKGVWAEEILSGAPEFEPAFVEAAVSLERRGASFLMSNCGFAISYKKVIEQNVSIPAAVSSLLLLPQLEMLLLPGQKIGLLTYDADSLTDDDLRAAWPALDKSKLVVGDIRGTPTWDDWGKRCPVFNYDEAKADVEASLQRLLDREPSIGLLLLECTGFPTFLESVKRIAGVPVFDLFSLAELMAGSYAGTREDAESATDSGEHLEENTLEATA